MMSRLGSIMVLCDILLSKHVSDDRCYSDYHQSGGNTTSRVGNDPSGSSEAGVFHSTTAAERTSGSHGAGTAYCGRIFGTYDGTPPHYVISTGIGRYSTIYESGHVPSDCVAASHGRYIEGYCDYEATDDCCPLGWGNRKRYFNFEPGCNAGTYYPNPTPASPTNVYTGSRKCKNPQMLE